MHHTYTYMYYSHNYIHMDIHIHEGKDASLNTDDVGVTHAVVLKLLEHLENHGHHIYMDNYYSSPALFQNFR